jgi:hypothetical protein
VFRPTLAGHTFSRNFGPLGIDPEKVQETARHLLAPGVMPTRDEAKN